MTKIASWALLAIGAGYSVSYLLGGGIYLRETAQLFLLAGIGVGVLAQKREP